MANGYPAPRPRDAVAASAGAPDNGAPVVNASNYRIFPFLLRSQGGAAVAVSPQFVGYGIIDELVLGPAVPATNPPVTMQVYISDDNSGGGFNPTVTFQPTGEPVFDNNVSARDDGISPQDAFGITLFNQFEVNSGMVRFKIGRVTTKAKFYVKVRLATTILAGVFIQGHVRVRENIPAEALANFA